MPGSSHKQMNFFTTVVALVNGMIGGSILVLPLISQQGGWMQTLIIIFGTGLFSFYSCYLSIIHLGDQKDLDQALLRHFNGSKFLKIFYDFCVWSGIFLLLILYFQLIAIQWQGLIPPYQPTKLNPILNGIVLLAWCICLKFFQFGAHIMGYGIISIVGYLIFLIWVIASAPSGGNTIPAFGTGAAGFAAMMGNAFSIQGFFIPVIRCYKQPRQHVLLLLIAYIIGGLAYYYIAYMGAFGIVNRIALPGAQTIQGYFSQGEWQVKILQGIYLVHLYSVFPQYLLISKKRFFSMLGLKQSKEKKVNVPELVYIIVLITLCVSLTVVNVDIDVIIDINGAVLGFCFVYFLPSFLHLKCMYFPKGKRMLGTYEVFQNGASGEKAQVKQQNQNKSKQIQLQQQSPGDDIQSKKTEQNDPNFKKQKQQLRNGPLISERQSDLQKQSVGLRQLEQSIDYSFYYCGVKKLPKHRQIIDLILLSIMFLMGAFIMINGLIQVANLIK